MSVLKNISWFYLLLFSLCARAEYEIKVQHVRGDDVMVVTDGSGYKFEFKGGDSELLRNSESKFVAMPGLQRPFVWTEWTSGQTSVIKVFNLNCIDSAALRFDRQTYGLASSLVQSSGLRVTYMEFSPYTDRHGDPQMVDWIVPTSCESKASKIGPSK